MTHTLVDVSDTRKQLSIEIPAEVVDASIARVTRSYAKSARVPGFRPAAAACASLVSYWQGKIDLETLLCTAALTEKDVVELEPLKNYFK